MSEKEHLLGIDVGTYSAKGVLVHRDGTVKASHTVEYTVDFPRPGWAEQDADEVWWASFTRIARALLEESGVPADDIAAVGCSAIGITMLPVDRQGRPLRPSVLYGIDTRATKEIEALNAAIGKDEILRKGWSRLSANSVGPKILWLKNNEPDVFARTHKVLTASAYLAFKLTGEYTIDTFSTQSLGPMIDMERMAWDAAGAAHVCSLDLLPTIRPTTDVIGGVHAEAAAQTGLAVGTPVIAGVVDAAAEAISVGVTSPGDTMLMLGTTVIMTHVMDELVHRDGLLAAHYLVEGTYALNASLATSAALTRWFKDNYAHDEVRDEARDGVNAYVRLAEQAAEVAAGSEGLVVLPYFSGERSPMFDPRARGVIAGLTLSHTRKHVYRALLEGVAYSIRQNAELMVDAGGHPTTFTAVGGGCKNPLWLQIIADVTGMSIEVPARTIGASFGDAYLAGVGVGMFDGFDELRRSWIAMDRVVTPDPKNEEVYSATFDVYRRMYPKLVEEMHDLADLQTG